jgi:uncharacterized protein YcnI
MNRLTAVLTRRAIISVLGGFALGTALPKAGGAQGRRGAAQNTAEGDTAKVENEALIGTWKLNLAKSKYSPGPAPKSGTLTYRAEGGRIKRTAEGIDAEGKATKTEWLHIYDGSIFQQPGSPDYDAGTYKLFNANTVIFTRIKSGRQVQTGSIEVSSDGKTLTVTTKGVDSKGQQINNVAVYDRQ